MTTSRQGKKLNPGRNAPPAICRCEAVRVDRYPQVPTAWREAEKSKATAEAKAERSLPRSTAAPVRSSRVRVCVPLPPRVGRRAAAGWRCWRLRLRVPPPPPLFPAASEYRPFPAREILTMRASLAPSAGLSGAMEEDRRWVRGRDGGVHAPFPSSLPLPFFVPSSLLRSRRAHSLVCHCLASFT